MRQKVGYGLGSFLDMWGHWLYQSLAFQVFNIFLGVAPGLISTVHGDQDRHRRRVRRDLRLAVGQHAHALGPAAARSSSSAACSPASGLPLMFAVGRGWTDTQYFTFMLVSLLVYVPVMSCFNMPWVSLGSEMTPDYHERTSVMQIKNAIQKVPELAMFVAAQFTTLAIVQRRQTASPTSCAARRSTRRILGAIMVALSIAIFLLVRERYYEKVVVASGQKVPFRDTLYRTLKNRPFRTLLGMSLAYATATAMVRYPGLLHDRLLRLQRRRRARGPVEHRHGRGRHGVRPGRHRLLRRDRQAHGQARGDDRGAGRRDRRLRRRLVVLRPRAARGCSCSRPAASRSPAPASGPSTAR